MWRVRARADIASEIRSFELQIIFVPPPSLPPLPEIVSRDTGRGNIQRFACGEKKRVGEKSISCRARAARFAMNRR